MDISANLELCRQALYCALLVSAPLLLAAVAAGTITSMLQSMLHIHDTTPLLIARVVVTGATLVVLMPWLLDTLKQFAMVAWGVAPQWGTS